MVMYCTRAAMLFSHTICSLTTVESGGTLKQDALTTHIRLPRLAVKINDKVVRFAPAMHHQ